LDFSLTWLVSGQQRRKVVRGPDFVNHVPTAVEFRAVTANIQRFQPNAPASSEALAALRAALPKPLPEGYVAFLQRTNGGEGFLGERYLRLWRAEELIEVNRGYNVAEFFPNLFLIGTDGGGEAYGFDVSGNDATVFEVPFIGMPSDASAIANSFDSFLAALGAETDTVNE
jgi:hypothetical protein